MLNKYCQALVLEKVNNALIYEKKEEAKGGLESPFDIFIGMVCRDYCRNQVDLLR